MKIKHFASVLVIVGLTTSFVSGQEPQKQENTATNSSTKSADYNSSRSNKTSSVTAPEGNSGGNDSNAQKFNQNSSRSNHSKAQDQEKPESQATRKGYDAYKAQSDLKSDDAKQKAPDHNSTRSNKSGPK